MPTDASFSPDPEKRDGSPRAGAPKSPIPLPAVASTPPTWTVRNADGTWPALPKEGERVIVMRLTEIGPFGDAHAPITIHRWYEEYASRRILGKWCFSAWSYPPAIPNFTPEA